MKSSIQKISFILSIVFILALLAGCTSNSGTTPTTPAASTTTPVSGALYSAGDVVKNPKTSSVTALLVTGYDPSTDMYERALIYPNSDGTWGYRMNTNTEKISRVNLEKVYTQKVTHVTASAIPVRTPTPVTTTASAYQTTASSAVTTVSATTTTLGAKPQVRSIDPDSATAGNTVSITDLEGYNFQTNATVALAKSGDNNIQGTNVKVLSASQIACTFVIPLSTTVGAWDILVTNPDGQFHRYQNGFTVRENMNPTATTSTTTSTTTSSASTGSISISMVDPTTLNAGPAGNYLPLTVTTGSDMPLNSNIILKRSSSSVTMNGTSANLLSTTRLKAFFNLLPDNYSSGTWDVVIVNGNGGVIGTLSNGVTII